MNVFTLLFVPLLFSGIISFGITPLVIRLAWKWGMIDDPTKKSHPKIIHTKPTPRGGGLAIFVSLFISSLVLLPLDKHLMGILAGALIITVMGLLDDKYDLNPYHRLFIQFFAASLPIAAGIGIAYVSNPLGGVIDLSTIRISFNLFGSTSSIWLIADFFALFWIVTLMNFLNMGAKGVSGQLSGVVAITALVISLLSLRFSADIAEWPVTILSAILAGAFLGFLPWHVEPQRIMPSFSGSNLAGYMLGVLSILTTTKIGTLAVVLAIPLIDTLYNIIRRVRAGKSPVWGDRGHLHHKLLDLGWSKNQIALFYWLLTLGLGLASLSLNPLAKFTTIGLIALVLISFLTWISTKH